jgi:hypothetical protein
MAFEKMDVNGNIVEKKDGYFYFNGVKISGKKNQGDLILKAFGFGIAIGLLIALIIQSIF